MIGAGAALLLATACAAVLDESADFERHRYSQLIQPHTRPDKIFFDVRFGQDYPENDPKAESARLEWVAAWLKQRRLCPGGYDIADRRPFDLLEDNPGGYQQRWEIRCRASSAG